MDIDLPIRGVLVDASAPRYQRHSAADEARAAFLARFRNDNTRNGYATSLRQWFGFCAEHGIEPLEAKRAHIELFCRALEISGRTPATVAAKMNALAGFYKFAIVDEIITRNPMDSVSRPKVERVSTTQGLTRTEFGNLLSIIEEFTMREQALVLLLGYHGLRISEALGIQIDDLGLRHGQATVHIARRKGGKSQTLHLAARVAYLMEQTIDGRTFGPVFTNSIGRVMDRKAAARIITRVIARAGIKKHITPHSFRHTFVTMALDSGMRERDIAITTGHADTRMVTYYDRGRDSVTRSAIPVQAVASWVESAA